MTHVNELIPHFDVLKSIKNYSDLLKLDKSLLKLLVHFEEENVKSASIDEYIDARTSGHHTDCLEIYQAALEGLNFPEGCFVFMNDDGQLNFDIVDVIQNFIDDQLIK